MNSKLFFDHIRANLFSGKLTQGVVDTIQSILLACNKYEVIDYRKIAYILATAKHESYHPRLNPDWLPVREGWGSTNQSAINEVTAMFKAGKISKNYALPLANGQSYYGRGFVQITHPGNYATMGKRLGVDLYNYPDKALQRPIASEILVVGMKEGTFTGKKLSDYFNGSVADPVNARRMINGLDKTSLIKDYYNIFLTALSK